MRERCVNRRAPAACSLYGNLSLVYTSGKRYSTMHVIARRTLCRFWARHPDAESSLKAWFAEAKNAEWTTPQSIKERYGSASFVGNDRVAFNICGDKYRLVVLVKYEFRTVYVRFIGTHAEYDKIDAEEI